MEIEGRRPVATLSPPTVNEGRRLWITSKSKSNGEWRLFGPAPCPCSKRRKERWNKQKARVALLAISTVLACKEWTVQAQDRLPQPMEQRPHTVPSSDQAPIDLIAQRIIAGTRN
ncbi:hypothetical protein MAPG_01810 [Magnaporthiopsis poae ATCC 64411]|uniref:Uncharacterized protein n=1 Tax=Magnaporthiopsis poae (strain ATCC 64411 / 73-15) TaxID=644358 RepID=A0A0C4DPN9_MAGP6|nr:hypothetical protein MAPG_01810 [Magnaporthiopsis poae ATCC 64411]